jgi:hypothetical protein
MRWQGYVAAQSAFGKRRRRRLSGGQQRKGSEERYGYEIAALERACNGAIAFIGRWAARHVHLIRDRHCDRLR